VSEAPPKNDKRKPYPKGPLWARSIAVLRERAEYLEQRRADGLLGGYRQQELHHLRSVVTTLEAVVPVVVDLEWELQKRGVGNAEIARLHERLLRALVKAGIVPDHQGPAVGGVP
jgi:hypothetical protein